MININLRPGKRRKSVGAPFNFKGVLDTFRDFGAKVKDPLLLGAVGACSAQTQGSCVGLDGRGA